jgi:hypothetical protein
MSATATHANYSDFSGEDQRAKVCEIAEVTGIAKSTVHEIISDLNFHKESALLALRNDH